jgi:hypothetical protein
LKGKNKMSKSIDDEIEKLKQKQFDLDPTKLGYSVANNRWAEIECTIHRLLLEKLRTNFNNS